jgi:uncharacterized protein (TIGR04222 family)
VDAFRTELWQQLRDFQFDESGSPLTFLARLAREQGWSLTFAKRVVDEYKRFVFLAMVADHEVTPSQIVDEAWHLHLTYTRSYWDNLCRKVLGKPLHHIPTRGGEKERSRHNDQYAKTLASYERWFGETPPDDIWPITTSGDTGARLVQVDRNRAWVISKPRWPKLEGRTPAFVGALALPVMLGVVNPFDLAGLDFLKFYVIVCIAAIAVALALRHFLRVDPPASDQRELSPYEIACLGGGTPSVLRACLARLVAEKRLLVKSDVIVGKPASASAKKSVGLFPGERISMSEDNMERAILQATDEYGSTPKQLLDAGLLAAREIQADLQSRGLLESAETFAAARWWPLVLLAIVWLLGFVKVLVGLERERPVGFLIAALVVLAFVMVFFWRRPLRSRRGQRLFHELRDKHASLKTFGVSTAAPATTPDYATNILLAAGLFGLASVSHPDVNLLNKTLKPAGPGSYAAGCGASGACGGAGCGGGGGGGGGCGGGCGGCGGGD